MASSLFLVDDDEDVQETLSAALRRKNFNVSSFSRGDEFLAALEDRTPDCILLDLQMPGLSGIQLLKILSDQQRNIPAFMMSGFGDIPNAVQAVRMGALDFFEKPFLANDLADRIRDNLNLDRGRRGLFSHANLKRVLAVDALTDREQEVLSFVSKGKTSKEVAKAMGISARTVEVHRSRILEKLNAKNFIEVGHRLFVERAR